MKRWAARIIQLLISVTLVLAISECSVRKFAPQGLNLLRVREDGVYSHAPGTDVILHGLDTQARVKINSDGLRDVERPRAKPPGVTRVLVLGDSMVEGFQVELEETLPKQLEQRLSKAVPGRKFDVINAGVSGSSAPMALLYLERDGLTFDPDLVVVTITTRNDVREAADTRQFPRLPGYEARVFLRSRFQLYTLFESAIYANPRLSNALAAVGILSRVPLQPAAAGVSDEARLYDGRLEPYEIFGYERMFEAYSKMMVLCHERNISVLFVILPSYFQATGYAVSLGHPRLVGKLTRNYREIQDRLLAFFQKRKAEAVDILPGIRRNPEAYFLPRDRHFSVAGNAFAAEETAREILERGLLASRRPGRKEE